MLPRLLRLLAAFLLFFSLSLPFATAQNDDTKIERGVKLDKTEGTKSSGSPAAFPYFALAIYTMLILTIVCMPSRKA